MTYVDNLLARHERVVRVARDHWITLLPTILVDGAVSIFIVGVSTAGLSFLSPWTLLCLLLLAVPIGHLSVRIGIWWNKQIIVTNRRVVQVTGTFNKRVSDTLLEKVNDIVTEQSVWGRLFRFGDIEIISGSESGTDVFHHISYPVEFKKALFDQREALTKLAVLDDTVGRVLSAEAPSVGDIPGLIVKLDELRQKGLITDAEFEDKRTRLLAKI